MTLEAYVHIDTAHTTEIHVIPTQKSARPDPYIPSIYILDPQMEDLDNQTFDVTAYIDTIAYDIRPYISLYDRDWMFKTNPTKDSEIPQVQVYTYIYTGYGLHYWGASFSKCDMVDSLFYDIDMY